jgi:hypothetical protein
MRRVRRDEILDYVTYEERRESLRAAAMAAKAKRRVHVGDCLTLLFENTDTIRYQIQEMVRIERMVKETDIQHELATYNELLGGEGELGCTLLIEIDDPVLRQERLTRWLSLPSRMFVRLPDGERVYARFDDRQLAEHRLSSVQYLRFQTAGRAPVAVGCDLEELRAETELSAEQRRALAEDLAS